MYKTEVEAAISNTKNGKTPGPHGPGIEFYKNSWRIIGSDVTQIFQNGKISNIMKKNTSRSFTKKKKN